MKRIVIPGLAFLIMLNVFGVVHEVSSPDGQNVIKVEIGETVSYSVSHRGQQILAPSLLSMTLDGGLVLGQKPQVKDVRKAEIKQTITPVVKHKRASIPDNGNELTIDFEGDYSLIFRAYNDGVAYRFATRLGREVKVVKEQATFAFPADYPGFLPVTKTLMMSFEKPYVYEPISKLAADDMVYLPITLEAANGVRIAITESALEDYAGMFLKKAAQANTLEGTFANVPLQEKQLRDRYMEVTQRADYIAATKGTRSYPWRLMIVADSDGALIESDLVYRLADPPRLQDTSWIRPGKVDWDWWNALNVYGVDFASGVNNPTYKHYIDFAAANGIEYVILDEGWSEPTDLLKLKPEVDLKELVQYANQKKVGLILWVVWLTLDRQLEPAMKMFQDLGIKGIKVDFMDRDDQKIVNYYWTIAAEAAKRKLLVDFHGAYKPAGLDRTYPNVITREGVMGLEYSKWSDSITPEHDVTIPFTRMLAGPMDCTPGAMANAQKSDFKAIFERPMSQGTRCHQLAMFVVYESPLQMLCDTPSHYSREPEILDLLSKVPSVWDETRVLDGKIGDYVVIARRNGQDWYVGAMTDWSPRTLTIDLAFLNGRMADVWQDGVNANRWASDFKLSRQQITGKMEIKLAPGGGWVARVRGAK
ncbi:MAG: glycoside hydrolase family 97 protein [Acidobacteria bacterium]|nr:MAG: glycoside hydrolase family 97 protein [Euryarchaeota archaeon]RPJ63409.1 MAG: glycoside hydrolase family 97 protein [Acidobacteriota bacterium]